MHLVKQGEVFQSEFAHLSANSSNVCYLNCGRNADNVGYKDHRNHLHYIHEAQLNFIREWLHPKNDDRGHDRGHDWLNFALAHHEDESETDKEHGVVDLQVSLIVWNKAHDNYYCQLVIEHDWGQVTSSPHNDV